MKRLFLLLSLLYLLPASAMIRYVPAQYATIQQAINSSVPGDTVIVAPGVYTENINFNGKDIAVASEYLLTGDTARIGQTVIDGSNAGISANDRSVVTFENHETGAALLCGFTIKGGHGNIRLLGFHSFYYGGGIFCDSSGPGLKALRIRENTSDCGGGLFLYYSDVVMEDCDISDNTCFGFALDAPDAGGGMAMWGCQDPVFVNVRITHNSTAYAGGGLYTMMSGPRFINTLLANNQSSSFGCALYADRMSEVSFINSTIVSNNASGFTGAGAVYCIDSVRIHFRNSIFAGNLPGTVIFQGNYSKNSFSASYSNIEGGVNAIVTNNNGTVNWGSGNISAWPVFADTTAFDYHLQNASPCINAGDTAGIAALLPAQDLDGNPRVVSTIDMGVYESGNTTGIEQPDADNRRIYPNPAKDMIRVDGLEAGKDLVINLYSVTGQRVRSWSMTGKDRVQLFLGDLSRGIYMVELIQGDRRTMYELMVDTGN